MNVNTFPKEIFYIIYRYVHNYYFRNVLYQLLDATIELKDYEFDYGSDLMNRTYYIQKCINCGYKRLYGCPNDAGYRVCLDCVKILKSMPMIY